MSERGRDYGADDSNPHERRRAPLKFVLPAVVLDLAFLIYGITTGPTLIIGLGAFLLASSGLIWRFPPSDEPRDRW